MATGDGAAIIGGGGDGSASVDKESYRVLVTGIPPHCNREV
jgi:hypothetical protein